MIMMIINCNVAKQQSLRKIRTHFSSCSSLHCKPSQHVVLFLFTFFFTVLFFPLSRFQCPFLFTHTDLLCSYDSPQYTLLYSSSPCPWPQPTRNLIRWLSQESRLETRTFYYLGRVCKIFLSCYLFHEFSSRWHSAKKPCIHYIKFFRAKSKLTITKLVLYAIE